MNEWMNKEINKRDQRAFPVGPLFNCRSISDAKNCFFFKADPYLIVSLGKKKYDEQDNFKPNTLNPVFGK